MTHGSGPPIDPRARAAVEKRALDLLGRREHSVAELAAKLQRRGNADQAVVRAVVQELADQGLVSDSRYAAAYARDAVRLKPRARLRLVTELVEKGVPASTAAVAVDRAFEQEEVDDEALARRLAEAFLPRVADADATTRWRRLGAYLKRRGFGGELVYDICESLLPRPDEAV